MLFRKLLPLFAPVLIASSSAAHAQFGVFGTVTGQRFGGIACPAFAAPCGSNDGVVRPYGGAFGAFYDLRDVGPVRLGVDLRGDVLTANKRADSSAGGAGIIRQYSVLSGIRGSVRTPISWIRPYAEITGGIIRNNAVGDYTVNTTLNTATGTTTNFTSFNPSVYTVYGTVKGFVGIDVRISPILDIRAIEFGDGESFGSSPIATTVTTTFNGSTVTGITTTTTRGASSHDNQSLGAGIVFHFPR